MQELQQKTFNPVLLYKPQGNKSDTYPSLKKNEINNPTQTTQVYVGTCDEWSLHVKELIKRKQIEKKLNAKLLSYNDPNIE